MYVLSRNHLVSLLDSRTPRCVVLEIADGLGVLNPELHKTTEIISTIESIETSIEHNDISVIARFVNMECDWDEPTLMKALSHLLEFDPSKFVYESTISYSRKTPRSPLSFDACILYSLCVYLGIDTRSDTTPEKMCDMLNIYYSGEGIDAMITHVSLMGKTSMLNLLSSVDSERLLLKKYTVNPRDVKLYTTKSKIDWLKSECVDSFSIATCENLDQMVDDVLNSGTVFRGYTEKNKDAKSLISREKLSTFDIDDIITFGTYGDDDTHVSMTLSELRESFLSGGKLCHPESHVPLSDRIISKICSIDKRFIPIFEDLSSKSQLSLIKTDAPLDYYNELLHLGMTMRGWGVVSTEYPLRSIETHIPPDRFGLLESLVSTRVIKLLEYGQNTVAISYVNGSFFPEKFNLEEQLRNLDNGEISSCMRTLSNYIISTSWFHLDRIGEKPTFHISEISSIF